MRYLFCEDSKGGFVFWKKVNELLLNSHFEVLESAGGRGELPKLFAKYLTQYEAGDTIMIAIDRIPKSEGILADLLKLYENCLLGKFDTEKQNLIITNYWCVEEILVSFAFLADWSKVTGDIIKPWNRIRDFISNPPKVGSSKYHAILRQLQNEVIIVIGAGRHVTREKFYARVLGKLIDNGLGQFSFTKHEQGTSVNTSCWFNDCCELKYNEGCQNKCGLVFGATTAQERLRLLFENSLMETRSYGLPFVREITSNFEKRSK